MPSNYPANLDELTDGVGQAADPLQTGHVGHHTAVGEAVEAVQAELGNDPAGAAATVRARLDTLDTTVAGKAGINQIATLTPRNHLVLAASDAPATVKSGADFICDGTGDQAEIATALADVTNVQLTPGTFGIAATLNIPDNAQLVGAGAGAPIGGGAANITWAPATKLIWQAGTDAAMLQVGGGTAPIGGVWLDGFGLDCASAGYALVADWLQASVIGRLAARNFLYDGILLRTSSTVADANLTGCDFGPWWLSAHSTSTGALIRAHGNAGNNSNVCHNLFRRVFGRYYGDGVVFENTDNNTMIGVFFTRLAGSGYGMVFGPRARGNYIYHLEAGAGGLLAQTPAIVTSPPKANVVFGYDRDNGQPTPTLQTPYTQLEWTESGANSTGWHANVRTRKDIALAAQGVLSEPYDRGAANTGTALGSGTLYLVGVGLRQGDRVSGIAFRVATGGSGFTLAKVGLYHRDGTLLASSADQGAAWAAVNTFNTALTSAYNVPADGLYYLAVLVTGSSPPGLLRQNTGGFGGTPVGSSAAPFAIGGSGLSDLPSTATISQSGAVGYWIAAT